MVCCFLLSRVAPCLVFVGVFVLGCPRLLLFVVCLFVVCCCSLLFVVAVVVCCVSYGVCCVW